MEKYISAFIIFLLSGCSTPGEKLIRKADKIHNDFLTVDSHCDTPLNLINDGFDPGIRNEHGSVDFPRMKEGGLDAEFFAVFNAQGPRNDSAINKVHEKTLKVFETIHNNISRNSSLAELALSPDDAYRLKKNGKISIFIGLENGYPAGKDIARIKEYYDLGARYITLCHSANNDICDSSSDPRGPEHNGLSEFGARVVGEMNRLGMMVDVSHISDKSFYDVIKTSKAPVIASHSSCRALCSNTRNLTDDMLLSLKSNGGVIQICILSNYLKTPEPNPVLEAIIKELHEKYGPYNSLSEEKKKQYRMERMNAYNKYRKLATVSDVVDHIDHVVQVIGIDHVGIGTDFDGGGGVEGCRSVAELKNITIELLHRGYSSDDIGKIWGGNIMRVFREAENVAGKHGNS